MPIKEKKFYRINSRDMTRTADQISTKSLLEDQNMLSGKQNAFQIKLT